MSKGTPTSGSTLGILALAILGIIALGIGIGQFGSHTRLVPAGFPAYSSDGLPNTMN